jgi:hypothetical protein
MNDNKLSNVEAIATQIVCADIANGQRTYWIHELSDAKTEAIINKAVWMAKQIVDKANS